jgi:hypothetical protein
MPRATREEVTTELDRLASVITERQRAIRRDEIAEAYAERFGERLEDRTLQRRLKQLLERDKIETRGKGPATEYLAKQPEPAEPAREALPLTPEALEILSRVRQPLSRRAPVGYDADWLYAYEPGRTWYLPESVRADMRRLGSTPGEQRPAGTFARDILDRLLIDLAWASSRLEGNTYTRLDTQNLIEFGQRAEGKDAREAQMILNHKAAIELLVSGAEDIGFNARTLSALHAALSANLLGNEADEGRLRERPVLITGTTYVPVAIPQVIRECFHRIVDTVRAIPDPFEQAFFMMVHLPYLQPFVDVNKRTSRLAANISLVLANLCPLSFVDVPESLYVEGTIAVYEQRRVELLRDVFVFAYARSCAQYKVVRDSLGQPDPVRLRYYKQIGDAITQIVRAGAAPTPGGLRTAAPLLGVPPADIDAFAEAALRVLISLNEGSAARHGLTPREFTEWRARFASSP